MRAALLAAPDGQLAAARMQPRRVRHGKANGAWPGSALETASPGRAQRACRARLPDPV